jgi:hypothetical protein
MKTTELADSLATAAERLLWQVPTNDAHLGGCRPYAGPQSVCEPGCAVDATERALAMYLAHRSERPFGWRGYFSRALAEALAAASRVVGGQ